MGRKARKLKAARKRAAATREILRVVNRSPADYQPVFDTILANATRLCEAPLGLLLIREPDGFHVVSQLGPHPECAEYYRTHPVPDDPQRSATSRCAAQCRPLQTLDVADDPIYHAGQEHRRLAVEVDGVRSQLTVPLVRDGEGIGVILVYRREVRAFDAEHVALLSDFAEMAAIALENVRRFKALSASLERQTATGEILRTISRSPTDYRPVFDAILDSATRLCDAPLAFLLMREGDAFHFVAHRGSRPEFVEFVQANPIPIDAEGNLAALTARTGVAQQLADITDSDDYRKAVNIHRVASVDVEGIRTMLFVPMMKGGRCVGLIALYRREVRTFDDGHVALASTFADQAIIAVDNVRLFQQLEKRNAELNESLERQTATSEILRAISRTPSDYQPVFDTILEHATRLCRARFGALFLVRDDHLHPVAFKGVTPEFADYRVAHPIPIRDGTSPVLGDAARERVPKQILDWEEDALRSGVERRVAAARLSGIRTLLGVPILKGGETVGVIGMYRKHIEAFADGDIELVRTFADQAVIAIENVRSFQAVQARTAELTRSLERQTATSEILRVISRSPSDYQPVFDTILEHATRLCRAPFGALFLVRDGQLHPVAVNGPPDFVEYWLENPISIADESSLVLGGTARERVPKQVRDYAELARRSGVERRIAAAEVGGIRTLLGVPILKGDEVAGVILMYRQEVEAFADGEVELVSTFADQAVIAIENVRSFQAVQARTAELTKSLERQTATSEILRAISRSPTDYQPVFETILDNATRLCGAPFGSLFLVRDGHLHFVADAGSHTEFQEYLRANPFPLDHPAAVICRAARERAPHQVADLADETYRAGEARRVASVDIGGIRSLLGVPMLKGEEVVGVIALYRREVSPFDDKDVELVETFADQAVIAIENVRLFQELQSRSAELARSVAELEALGEVAQAVSSSLDLDTVLETIIERAVELSGADAGAVHELDESTGTLPPRAAPNLEELLDLPAPRVGEGAVGRAAASRAPVQIPDITVPGAYTGVLLDALSHLRLRAVLAVPMVQDDRVLGTLVVARRTPGEFPPETVRLLRALGTQSSIAIRNARLFREIEDKSRELEAANRHKSEFLANMSHELRTPLNAVIGFSEVLGERMFGELNDKQTEYVGDIHDSGRHLLSLINDILDLSKIEAGAMELDVGRFALAPALENAVTLVKERAGRRGLSLESRFDGDLGEMEGDERKLKQILLNLLSNAIKFTGEGGHVTLEAQRSDGAVEIAVRDTGVGISQEDRAVIFEEFRQVGTDYARKVEGTGLGLTLTRRFVEMHGGTIAVESTPGEGSRFRVTLPLHPPETST